MIFTSIEYIIFLVIAVCVYWSIKNTSLGKHFLLISSYVFYGWVNPWICLLLFISTCIDYTGGLLIESKRSKSRLILAACIALNLGILAYFKYFNFFADSLHFAASSLGLEWNKASLEIFLPIGISFFTFQKLGYTIDVYRRKLESRRNFVDFALFVAFFPQLLAGPIGRASQLLPQIEAPVKWNRQHFHDAWPLIVRGFFKKLVVADNIAVYADQIFNLDKPSIPLLAAGTAAFTLQIYGDFSGYTDIARGSAKLFGVNLAENFNSPYLAVTPSDFWRRWHISLSSWINDYLYVPLGGSRVSNKATFAGVLFATLGLSGLWHGAAWHYVIWGVYHAVLLFFYHSLGMGGKWRPSNKATHALCWLMMLSFISFGWLLFRAPSMNWLLGILGDSDLFVFSPEIKELSSAILAIVLFYSTALVALSFVERKLRGKKYLFALIQGVVICAICILAPSDNPDFIYFQF